VTDVDSTEEKLPEGGSYFFLSYARSAPLAGDWPADPDLNVRQFFDDLTDAVNSHASKDSGLIPGFFDQDIPVGADWNESVSRALGAAEVFVPLYSPGYFARSWPGREWACFHRRMELAGLKAPERRFAPVLWTPLPDQRELQWDQPQLPDLRAALEVGASESEYEKSGLRALRRISRNSYYTVVDQLAERVVTLAERSPLPPSAVPDIHEMKSRFHPEASLAEFAVAVAAPTQRAVPAGSDPACYADSSIQWRPFPGQELSLAECARRVAERLDFAVEFTSLGEACDPAAGRPGIILIDPWFIADDHGRALQSAVRRLPPWVLPLLVLSSPAGMRAGRLAEKVKGMLSQAGAMPAESSRRASRSVSSLKDFIAVVPALVAEAERRFLRHGGGQAPSGHSGGRRRLSDAAHSDTPTSAPHPAGEAPDA
jgi:FxsC-like protein